MAISLNDDYIILFIVFYTVYSHSQSDSNEFSSNSYFKIAKNSNEQSINFMIYSWSYLKGDFIKDFRKLSTSFSNYFFSILSLTLFFILGNVSILNIFHYD